jgi:sensor histidine kinase regulating citrate/malate metabolism
MKRSSRIRQAGISFFGLVFVIAVLAGVGVLVAQAIPTMIEYQAVLKAVENAKTGSNPVEVRSLFDRSAQVDDIKSISGKDLEIAKNGDKMVVKFAYNKEIHMFGPAHLLLKYAGQSK